MVGNPHQGSVPGRKGVLQQIFGKGGAGRNAKNDPIGSKVLEIEESKRLKNNRKCGQLDRRSRRIASKCLKNRKLD